jgi:ribosomal protein S18 acetylase RimI-like enzyme
MDIRHPRPEECAEVHVFVQTIVDEVYGGLWAQAPLLIGQEDWSRSWMALEIDTLVGVVLTREEWVEDLWIAAAFRGRGVGSQLLATAEAEIRALGIRTAWLHVLSLNPDAIRFYKQRGWQVAGEYPHERFPVLVTEMQKPLCS